MPVVRVVPVVRGMPAVCFVPAECFVSAECFVPAECFVSDECFVPAVPAEPGMLRGVGDACGGGGCSWCVGSGGAGGGWRCGDWRQSCGAVGRFFGDC